MKDIQALLQLMARLRHPQTGCPWDQEQNFHTIAPYTIEEAYEVADAIERNSMDELKDELGDLLFQVVFHAQLASESGLFNFADVVTAIIEKMTRRHPHVFADTKILDRQQQTEAWEAQKESERQTQGRHSLLDNIPLALPALKRAEKIQKRVAKVGFDWTQLDPVIAKVQEELTEVIDEITTPSSEHALEEEVGDLLFACSNLARHLKLDPEQTLAKANNKFVRRFQSIEHHFQTEGRTLTQVSEEEMELAWQEVKAKEKAS
ncbi:MAG: nucleoside triphosphate pyrophosphohydrolase [Gammaproteobacteria bacterium]|nr:nucleoside triphosphate pyrophosphohydrolase [Gammaproteobacteria bacterium]